MIYLDWAASAIPYTAEIEAAYREATAVFANPSAQHSFGKRAKELLEDARSRCAAVLGVPAATLYFTSGASESNSIVLLSLLTRPSAGSVVIGGIEHPSVREQAAVLQHCGWTVLTAPADKNGYISPEAVVQACREDTVMAAIMSVNNEIGSIQPIHEIAAALRAHCAGKRPIHFHTDAVQSIGKLPVNRLFLHEADSASMSAHKIGGPRGIGLLYLKQPFASGIRGGSQEQNIRPGTENLVGACALARCLEKTYTDFDQKYAQAEKLSRFLIEELEKTGSFSLVPDGRSTAKGDAAFSPWIIHGSFKNLPAEVMMRCLSEHDIFVSAGSACSSKKKIRPVLAALSVPLEIAQNTLRLSIGPSTEQKDIEAFIAAVKQILEEF
ncbi:MAG: cysteine desulfurase family protein [Treponema sp.]